MSTSPNGQMDVDKSPNHKSSRNHSTDTRHTRRSLRSTSRERSDRKDRRRDDRKRPSPDRERYERDRSRERYRERDRDRDRRRGERDYDRHRSDKHRERGESRHSSHRDDRDKEDRRRKRVDDDEADASERSKKKKTDDDDSVKSAGSPRSSDRRRRPPRDPRDEFDDGPRYGRDRYRDDRRRPPPPPPRRSPSPPIRRVYSYDVSDLISNCQIFRRPSPTYETPVDEPYNPDEPKEDDSEARSVFVSQLAARLTARDLGYFFEEKLGENTVMDSRIVTDRLSRRSKGIGYVEFRSMDLVEKAMALTGTVVMGLPIMVQLTESERNRLHPGDGNLNLPPGVNAPHGTMQLYVGSLHFNLTESDIKQVFEPFGALEFVDLHRDPMTGRSKGYAFVQYKRAEDAKMALEQMEGFELAGRQLRVNTVHEKGATRYTQQDTLDESGGGNLNAASRQALMQKLARIDTPSSLPEPTKLNIPQQAMQSRSVLLKNMFDPEEESEKDWDKDLADDVKGECEEKYGPVEAIKVEKETQGEIYVKFDSVESAKKAVQGLNARWFGGRQVSAAFISDAIMQAHQ
ncbi:hypothetical protein EV368DRAFT_70719 [Lentinula lateritia]|uniref:Uncharacterized protein n=1 Tax=Lentinula aff. lateritia TaxID=2804960 RepID=A0ACC1UG13_9AGAR|nr:hypothetical protein F5876DRAFT_85355 [Lentinula aff. lateritia]KAJ3857800.1 hypothetical protein EV368DRAFT_70719 [Lentinula lateritia]